MEKKKSHRIFLWMVGIVVFGVIATVECQEVRNVSSHKVEQVLDYLQLKRQVVRNVRNAVLRLSKTHPNADVKQIQGNYRSLIRQYAKKVFKKLGKIDEKQRYKESLIPRILEGSFFALSNPQTRFPRPLVAGTRLYKIETQSNNR